MSEEIVEAGRRNDRFDPDFPRIEPADLITAIEQKLQRADTDGERNKSEPVKAQMVVLFRFIHEYPHAKQGDDPDRQLSVSQAPKVGPMIGPNITPTPQIAI